MVKKRVTLKDVAQAAGVHVSTASRALDPKSRHLIAGESAKRIIEISRQIGYRHNAAAVALRTNRTRMIGVVVPDITSPIFPPIIRGIEDTLSKRGYLAIMGNTDNDARREEHLILTLQERGVDGFILASVELMDEAVAKLAADIAVVTVNRRLKDDSVSSVVHDENEGIRRILTHLVALGHRRIASIGGPQHLSTGSDRFQAFQRHRQAFGLPLEPGMAAFAERYMESEGERCLEELLASGDKFTAILCANDRLAVGAIGALERRGLRCPEDISVTGYNDMPMMDRLRPALTTIRTNQYEIGVKASELLDQMIENRVESGAHLVLPVEMVVRGSTKAIG